MTWTSSPNVPVLERPPQPERTTTDAPELQRLKSALAAIPNSNNRELDYDNWFRIICAIHYATDGGSEGLGLAHEFSARSTKYDAEFLDSRVWPYVRSDRGGTVITERTVFASAAANGWQDPLTADDFDVIEPDAGNPISNPKRFAFQAAQDFTAGKPATWIVKNVIPQADLVVMYGESASGKSFFALDIAGAVARGVAWRGRNTIASRVGYIAAEGAGGFRNRLKAYGKHHGIALSDLNIAVLADAPNFMEKADIIDLVHAMRAAGPFGLIIVDTLAQVTAGSNENSGEDMGRVIGHCKTIHKVTGATVLLIHHSGKDSSKGARGWSGLRAAADAEIEITRADNDRCATVTKLKDGQDGDEFGFKLAAVPVDMDSDGEVIESCVVEHGEAAAKGRKAGPKGDVEKVVWQALLDSQSMDGVAPDTNTIIEASIVQIMHDGGKRDTRRQRVMRALEGLKGRGMVLFADGKLEIVSA